jgi:hypothetical protein
MFLAEKPPTAQLLTVAERIAKFPPEICECISERILENEYFSKDIDWASLDLPQSNGINEEISER